MPKQAKPFPPFLWTPHAILIRRCLWITSSFSKRWRYDSRSTTRVPTRSDPSRPASLPDLRRGRGRAEGHTDCLTGENEISIPNSGRKLSFNSKIRSPLTKIFFFKSRDENLSTSSWWTTIFLSQVHWRESFYFYTTKKNLSVLSPLTNNTFLLQID